MKLVKWIGREMGAPLFARLGTVFATYLIVEYAMDPEAANAIATGLGAAGGFLFDLVARKVVPTEGR